MSEGGRDVGNALVRTYNAQSYHQRSDEFDPDWDMAAAAQEGALAYALGRELADSHRWPE